MTAEEMLQDSLKVSHFYNNKYDKMCCFSDDVQIAMQEYAKAKCQELLLLVAEKAEIKAEVFGDIGVKGFSDIEYKIIDKDSILNVVDLDSFIV